MYNQKVKEHFQNPKNVGVLESPDAMGEAINAVDGDRVQLHLRIENEIIIDVKMKVMGCVAAIAATSCYTEMIKGLRVQDALNISKSTLSEALDGLPEQKIKCSLTCIDALHNACSTKAES